MMKYLLLLSLIVAGCTTPSVQEPVVLPPVIIKPVEFKAAWDKNPSAEVWTDAVVKSLSAHGADMMKSQPKDAAKWCPEFLEFDQTKRAQFYVYLISAMAERESNFRPELSYTEGFTDAKGKPVISRGLLQLSQESANGYACEVKEAIELHTPLKNLECSVRILNRWIGRDQYFGSSNVDGIKNAGGARYWSVMRDSSSSQAKIKAKTLAYCKELAK